MTNLLALAYLVGRSLQFILTKEGRAQAEAASCSDLAYVASAF